MTFGYKFVPSRQRLLRSSPPSCSVLCLLTLAENSSHSALFVFRHLRTLSFFGSQLSFALPTTCALFCKKQGVHAPVPSRSLSSPGTPFSRMATPTVRRSFSEGGLTPFPTSLTQKQGGGGWPALSTVEGSYQPSSDPPVRYFLTSLLRFFFSLFQVQWEHPFPVITGETQ